MLEFCKRDIREWRPDVFKEKGLFLLPVSNSEYAIVKGEGYVDIPSITSPVREYRSSFPFRLVSTEVGDSEIQHLDRAFALGLIHHFVRDDSLVRIIWGRTYTPKFSFVTNGFPLTARGVPTYVDAVFEGENQVVVVNIKSDNARNVIIQHLYHPFRQWMIETDKKVSTLFFQRTKNDEFHIWDFGFDDINDYNSIRMLKSARYRIVHNIPC